MYIALFKTKTMAKAYSKLSFDEAWVLLTELVNNTVEPIQEALVLDDTGFPDEGACRLVASLRTIK